MLTIDEQEYCKTLFDRALKSFENTEYAEIIYKVGDLALGVFMTKCESLREKMDHPDFEREAVTYAKFWLINLALESVKKSH